VPFSRATLVEDGMSKRALISGSRFLCTSIAQIFLRATYQGVDSHLPGRPHSINIFLPSPWFGDSINCKLYSISAFCYDLSNLGQRRVSFLQTVALTFRACTDCYNSKKVIVPESEKITRGESVYSVATADGYIEEEPTLGDWGREHLPGPKEVGHYVHSLFPFTHWIHRYNVTWLIGDLVAGITVGAVVIPQSMAYAKLANLPPEYGLYSSFMGVIIYWFFATSKDITIGVSESFHSVSARLLTFSSLSLSCHFLLETSLPVFAHTTRNLLLPKLLRHW